MTSGALLCESMVQTSAEGLPEKKPSIFKEKNTNINDFESSIRAVCEPIFDKPLKEISFGKLLLNLFRTARKYNVIIQPQLILLQKRLTLN